MAKAKATEGKKETAKHEELLDGLTDKQRRFCQEYVIDWNATRAAKAAGYSEETARSIGQENLTKPSIKNAISKLSTGRVLEVKRIEMYENENDIGWVYIISCIGTDFYKIGRTTNSPFNRVKSMQVGIPFDLDVMAAWKVRQHKEFEVLLHDLYAEFRVRGEWFLFDSVKIKSVFSSVESMLTKNEVIQRVKKAA